MAKVLKVVSGTEVDGTMVGLNITPAMLNAVQLGDTFYIPNQDAFVVLGTAVDDRDRDGNLQVDEAGNPKRRAVGQRIVAVKMIDGQPDSVQELYLGQIIKVDVNRKIVFNNELARAFRSSNPDAKLKALMCGKYLVVAEEGTCEDRIWNNGDASKGIRAGYLRDEKGKFLHETKPCFRWDVKNPGKINEEQLDDMVIDYLNENYAAEEAEQE